MRGERQLLTYADGMRRGYAVLTNGVDWNVWDLSKLANFQSEVILELNILDDSLRQYAADLIRLLRRTLHHRC